MTTALRQAQDIQTVITPRQPKATDKTADSLYNLSPLSIAQTQALCHFIQVPLALINPNVTQNPGNQLTWRLDTFITDHRQGRLDIVLNASRPVQQDILNSDWCEASFMVHKPTSKLTSAFVSPLVTQHNCLLRSLSPGAEPSVFPRPCLTSPSLENDGTWNKPMQFQMVCFKGYQEDLKVIDL